MKQYQHPILIILGGLVGGIAGALLGGLLGRWLGTLTSTSDWGDLIGALLGMLAGLVFGDIVGLKLASWHLHYSVRLFELILIPLGTVALILLLAEPLRLNSQSWILGGLLLLIPNIVTGMRFTRARKGTV